MGPSMREDPLLPHDYLRVRVHGSVLIAQPYRMKYCSGLCLLIDLLRGVLSKSSAPTIPSTA
jgi:hypothetical protein